MSCIVHHQGIQLILAYNLASLVILVAVSVERNVFISVSSLSFLFLFLPCPSLSSSLLSPLFLFSLSLGDDQQGLSLIPKTIHMKCQYLLSMKNKNNNIECHLLQILLKLKSKLHVVQ